MRIGLKTWNRTTPRLLTCLVLCLAVSGCSSGPRATQKPETDLVGEPPPRPVNAEPAVAKPVEDQTPQEHEEEVRVELVMLEQGNPFMTESGVKISLTGVAPATIVFETADASEQVAIEQAISYAEGQAFGAIWSFTRDGGMHLEWRPAEGPALTPKQATALAERELASELGCEGELSSSETYPGTVTLQRTAEGKVTCSATIGIYTRQVVTP